MKRFSNKIIFVTGAARGIGLVTAQQFALEGGRVIATDLDKGELDRAVSELIVDGGVHLGLNKH